MSGTNLGKMPILIVSLVIGIVMATTAIVPLVSDYSDAKTFTNEGYYNLSIIDEDTNVVITWDPTDPYIINVGTEEVDLSGLTKDQAFSIVGASAAIIRFSISSANVVTIAYNGTGGQKVLTSSGSDTANITVTDTSVVAVLGTVTRTAAITSGFYLDPDGGYIMKDKDTPAYIKDDSVIIAGLTNSYAIYGIGDVENGMTIGDVFASAYLTISNIEMNTTDTGYIDTYLLESITFDIVDSNSSTTTAATYSYFAVPEEITGIPDNPDSYKALVKVIPVMAFVALIAAAAFMIYSKRD